MSVAKAFKDYLVISGIAEGAVDVFSADNTYLARIPAANLSLDNQWAIVAVGGGTPEGGNLLKWKVRHTFLLMHRNASGKKLYDKDDLIQELDGQCLPLSPYKVISVRITPMTELEMSDERSHLGNWQVEITTSK